MTADLTSPHLVIACGGTGGHFYPTLAIAKEFCKAGGRVTLLVSGKHAAEQKETAEKSGFSANIIQTVRLPRLFPGFDLLAFPFRFLSCVLKAKKVLKKLQPDVLLGMGSFAAVPPCYAVSSKKVPLVLHEGNSVMGKANRCLAGRATAIVLSLPLKNTNQLKGCKGETLGMPLRQDILEAAKLPGIPEEYLKSHGLSANRRTVLVFGGSQGAAFINELLKNTLPLLKEDAGTLQFIHLTGAQECDTLKAAYKAAGLPALVQQSEPNIEQCYRAADLIICRGGASSLCEIALFQKPLLLIPLPSAAEDHQRINGEMVQAEGACKVLLQGKASPEILRQELQDWQQNPQLWQEMGRKLAKYAHPDAAVTMARLLFKTAKKSERA